MICSVTNCKGKVQAKGLCLKHYTRFLRNGTTVSKYRESLGSIEGDTKDTRHGHRGNLGSNIVADIRYKAQQRGKNWSITNQEAFTLIRSECIYCGFTPVWPKTRVGIDRVDNSIGYTTSNCVPCCFTCNSAKGSKSLQEFHAWIRIIYSKIS